MPRLLFWTVVTMTFNVQSCYSVFWSVRFIGPWCCLKKEFLQARSPDAFRSGKGIFDSWEGHGWRMFPWSCAYCGGIPFSWCVWVREVSLGSGRVREQFSQWDTWSVPLTGSASPGIVGRSLILFTEPMSLPGLPSVPTDCGLGNPNSEKPSSIGWGGP